ncbi:hypothetical protein [Corallococcus silvisoli]|uniref:hypothetical protein n=1 Tax=Corallococcus silvisoli TaxID=2697031 RepID=UPI0013778804|nr:hypothetical protein [Corallococcus silvisoli]NBD14486.1 hypothetical protein [Corallococcus silvisoli]
MSVEARVAAPPVSGGARHPWRLAAIALVAVVGLWPLFKYHVGPDNELRVRFPVTPGAPTGSVSFQREGHAPQQWTLEEASLWQHVGDGLPPGMQELHIALPRRAVQADVTLRNVPVRITQVSWVSRREPVGLREAPALAFDQQAEGDGAVRLHVPALWPGFWALDAADAVYGVSAWLLLWLVLEAGWGRGRVAAFGRRRAGWAKYALPLALAWGSWWAAFFPGLVSFDPLSQWQQLVQGRFSNWHPAFHTWWLGAFAWPFQSLGAASGFQVLLFATAMGKVLEELGHWKVPAWARWGVVLWAGLSPAVGVNIIAVWKDTPFTLMCLVSVSLLLRMERTRDAGAGSALRLGLCVACLGLLRHNGILLAVPALVTGLWRMRDRRARGLLLAAGLGGILFVRGPVHALAKVAPAPPTLTQVLTLHRLGAMAASPDLSEEDARVLESLMPLPAWRARYVCHAVGPLLFDHSPLGAAPERLEGRGLELAGVVARFALRHPGVFLDQALCVTRYVWAYEPKLYVGPFNGQGNTVDPNAFGFRTRSWLPRAQRAREEFFFATTVGGATWTRMLFWQPSLSLYLLLAGLLATWTRQRRVAPLLVFQAALLNTVGWLVLSPNPDLRFLFPTLVAAPLAWAWACAPRLRAAREGDAGAEGDGGLPERTHWVDAGSAASSGVA